MKLIFTALLVLATTFFSVAAEGDYLIDLEGNKVECRIYGNAYNSIKAMVDGKDMKYKADEIKGFVYDGVKYESGKVAYGSYGAKIWAFLLIVEEGDMVLSKIKATYYTKDNVRSTSTTTVKTPVGVVVHYVRLKDSDEYIKIGIKWKKDLAVLGGSCAKFAAKVKKEKYSSWNNEMRLKELIKYFNSDC